jgi:hypothetical protein
VLAEHFSLNASFRFLSANQTSKLGLLIHGEFKSRCFVSWDNGKLRSKTHFPWAVAPQHQRSGLEGALVGLWHSRQRRRALLELRSAETRGREIFHAVPGPFGARGGCNWVGCLQIPRTYAELMHALAFRFRT